MAKKKVGILGGTFNPIHMGHLVMAEQALTQLDLDEVRFMPDFIPPHVNSKTAIDADTRVEMVKLAIKGNPKFKLELAEVERQGTSYTYDTIKQLESENPDETYYFIIGEDMAAYLPKWKQIDKLSKMVHFIGVRRVGSEAKQGYQVRWIDSPRIEISSTMIRKMISGGQSIRYLVPASVLNYIKEEHLYE